MKSIELAKKFSSKGLSNLTIRLQKQKSKWISIFNVVKAMTLEYRTRTLFYVLPVKKSIRFQPVLSDKVLEKIRPKLQSVIERQTVAEEASRNLKQFAASQNIEDGAEQKKELTNFHRFCSILDSVFYFSAVTFYLFTLK